ncbi:hypothetical protein C8F01DRAFT_1120047 [Mycena amicta]|nr:hypothetical protein C8F01DRAFT_1120047 [Mycena amicta]
MTPGVVPPRQPAPFGAVPHSAQKEVQAILLKQRPSRRRPGDVPYPLSQYSSDLINFDNWDQMFFQGCFGGLTVHKFEDNPPQVILDLGCGGGHWAIQAAKQWPDAQVVGFDLHETQPEILELDAWYMRCLEDSGKPPHTLPVANIANRIEWIHGNLCVCSTRRGGRWLMPHISLDGLPFPSEYFDFEVCRVLQHNGVLEIIEDDLIFPCAPPPRPSRTSLAPLNLDFIRRDRRDSSAPPSAFSTRTGSSNSIPFDVVAPPDATLNRRDTFFQSDLDLIPPPTSEDHPQDHTRLKAAHDAMLSRRFLASSITTVLPFYLSTIFENVQTHPALQISLPPGSMAPDGDSRNSGDSFDADIFDLNPSAKRLAEFDMFSIKSRSTGSSQRIVPSWGRMHLAKTVATVSACKEALWVEYEKLYPGDLPPLLHAKTARPNWTRVQKHKNSPREAFETDWSNWENDMADRMSMRSRVHSEFGWKQPEQSPEARLWQNRMLHHREEANGAVPRSTAELCRSVRAFVGWKPAAD